MKTSNNKLRRVKYRRSNEELFEVPDAMEVVMDRIIEREGYFHGWGNDKRGIIENLETGEIEKIEPDCIITFIDKPKLV